MQFINALSLTPDLNDWLANSRHPRILHVFDHACNLINERGEVLSIVTQQIGNGPFNLVIENDVCFSQYLCLESPVSNSPTQLNLGDLSIDIKSANLWSPCPDWEMLHARRDDILSHIMSLRGQWSSARRLATTEITNYQLPITSLQSPVSNSLISNLSSALVTANIPSAITLTSQLAGLGVGLTPSGDDFILGAVLAAWIIHPPEVAGILAKEITNTAAPLTTSLSAAWLRSAGKGEAGILWHNLFDDLISVDRIAVQTSVDELLAVGHTSGADALAGFIASFVFWAVEARTQNG